MTRSRRFFAWLVSFGLFFGSPALAWAAQSFKPQEEFKLDPWVEWHLGPIDMSINKAVFYLFLAAAATIFTMVWIGYRMKARPNRVQTAIEAAYDLTNNQITRANLGPGMAGRWFAFLATLFFFIWFSNMIGYIPLPASTTHMAHIGGYDFPTFGLYAATANLSVPLALTLVVWFSYHIEGLREKGPIKYFRDWIPQGVTGAMAIPIFAIEVLSQFVRIISLSARLFANILAGHLLILLMGGGMIVLIGVAYVGIITIPVGVAFYIFEVGLVASLQAFIFAILSAIYLGEATEAH
ncbi:MAG: F0F1 ATP synthase subunit A [Actinomycetota bacterium]|nr:F0F1 ATP synthase subunit A [Actinomycetota bacterium]